MKNYLALVAVVIIACLALADAVWPKQPELLIDPNANARPDVWPTNAAAATGPIAPEAMICRPLLIGTPSPKPIVRT